MAPATVTAKTRKRCPVCGKMVEAGETATLTDDRFEAEAYKHQTGGMMAVQRGAFHLWHPACYAERQRLIAEADARAAADLEALRARILGH